MASNHNGTGTAKSPFIAGPSVAPSTNSFVRSLPFGNPYETEGADGQPPKGQGTDLTKFTTLQSLYHPLLHVLTDRVSKLEEETETALTAAAAELNSEVGFFESLLTDL